MSKVKTPSDDINNILVSDIINQIKYVNKNPNYWVTGPDSFYRNYQGKFAKNKHRR